jgi:hypothetical protein
MYIESKAESLQGSARIGRVRFAKSGKGIYYGCREFYRMNGLKANYVEAGSNEPYWISGPRKDGRDPSFSPSALPVEIDEDVREEYRYEIRQETGVVFSDYHLTACTIVSEIAVYPPSGGVASLGSRNYHAGGAVQCWETRIVRAGPVHSGMSMGSRA